MDRNHRIPDGENEIEEWVREYGEGGRVKTSRKPHGEESPREKTYEPKRNHRENTGHNPDEKKEEKEMQDKKDAHDPTQNPVLPKIEESATQLPTPTPAKPPVMSSKALVFSTKVYQLAGKQKAREEAESAMKGVRSEIASLQFQIREKQKTLDQQDKDFAVADSAVQTQLDQFDPDKGSRELFFMQSQIVIAPESEYQKIKEGLAELVRISSIARRMGIAGKTEGFTKTAETFRFGWQTLTEGQRDERGLEPTVSRISAKPLHRALKAYCGEEAAKKFLDALPVDWQTFVEGKIAPQETPPVKIGGAPAEGSPAII
ncbi:MAG: hypothetical protein Q7K28_02275 [Candidatus Wildermuthbacteria bacterium]|nr:hypothetical protein [Candidatus Wildermuthbacteria bacterium]